MSYDEEKTNLLNLKRDGEKKTREKISQSREEKEEKTGRKYN